MGADYIVDHNQSRSFRFNRFHRISRMRVLINYGRHGVVGGRLINGRDNRNFPVIYGRINRFFYRGSRFFNGSTAVLACSCAPRTT